MTVSACLTLFDAISACSSCLAQIVWANLHFIKKKKKAGNKWSNILPKSSGVPYGNMLHIPPTIFFLLAAKQEPYKKAYLLTKNIETFSGKKVKECAVLIYSWLSYIMELCLDHAILTNDYHKANQYINQQLTHLNQ